MKEGKLQHCSKCKSFVYEKDGKCFKCGTEVSEEKTEKALRELGNLLVGERMGVTKNMF